MSRLLLLLLATGGCMADGGDGPCSADLFDSDGVQLEHRYAPHVPGFEVDDRERTFSATLSPEAGTYWLATCGAGGFAVMPSCLSMGCDGSQEVPLWCQDGPTSDSCFCASPSGVDGWCLPD